MSSFELTNDEINRGVALVLGIPRDDSLWTNDEKEDVRACIRAGLRKFFHPLTPGGAIHQWRFLERQSSHRAEQTYDTGTVQVTAGVVTLTGGTFPVWTDDGVLRIGGETYYVNQRVSNTEATLFQTGLNVPALTPFAMHRWRFLILSDFGELIDGVVYSNGSESTQLQGATEHEIRLRYAANFKTGRTRLFSVVAGDEPTVQRWFLTFWPPMDPDSYLTFTYRAVPDDNLNADITLGGTNVQVDAVHAETLLAAIMSAAEEYMNDEPNGAHTQRYLRRLQQSIQHDRHSKGPVGFNNLETGVNPRAHSLLFHVPTYNDLLP